jgi:phosphatidylethanolamine-binding protein (PEBP) family uncharacterized protein
MLQPSLQTKFKVLQVTSPAFKDKGNIPRKYTCEGDDINPPLEIGSIPADAKSLAVVAEDPDAPSGNWLHWLVWNIWSFHFSFLSCTLIIYGSLA